MENPEQFSLGQANEKILKLQQQKDLKQATFRLCITLSIQIVSISKKSIFFRELFSENLCVTDEPENV